MYANKMHNFTNKRYYVLQMGGKIRVLTKTQIDYLVDNGYLRKSMKEFATLSKMSIYYTI